MVGQPSEMSIFISCTSRDLSSYRAHLFGEPILASHVRYVQEGIGARPNEPTAVCLELVRRCDVFIGLYGFRYGSLVPGKSQSITEAEFDEALNHGKRCLIYFADECIKGALLSSCEKESPDQLVRLDRFKASLQQHGLVIDTFKSPQELAYKVFNGIYNLSNPTGLAPDHVNRKWLDWLRNVVVYRRPLAQPNIESSLRKQWGKFIVQTDWKTERREELTCMVNAAQPRRQARKLDELAKAVEWRGSCKLVREQLERMVRPAAEACGESLKSYGRNEEGSPDGEEKARRFAKALNHFRRCVSAPRYSTAFLLTGDAGSGCTHFVTSLLVAEVEAVPPSGAVDGSKKGQRRPLFLPLELPGAGQLTLEQILLARLSEAGGGVRWQDIDEFHRFLGRLGGTLVVVVEDLHLWKMTRPEAISDLVALIGKLDRLENLRWLITVNIKRFHEVTAFGALWRSYGYSPSHPSEGDTVGGWLSLDDANEVDKIGIKIIQNKFANIRFADFEMDVSGATRHLINPLIAHIFIECGIGAPRNLVYIDFVKRLWDNRSMRLSDIANSDREISYPQPRDVEAINAVVATITDAWLATGKYLAPRLDVGREFEERAKIDGISWSFNLAAALLIQGGLIDEKKIVEEAFGVRTTIMCRFHPELIWQYHIASELIVGNIYSDMRDVVGAFESSGAPPEVKEGVVEFILLALIKKESEGGVAPGSFMEYCDDALCGRLPLTALFYAGGKAESAVQAMIFGKLADLPPLTDRLELFAFLMFMRNLTDDAAGAVAQLKKLQGQLPRIAKEGFGYYYIYMVGRVLKRVRNRDELCGCLEALQGCEEFDGEFSERPRTITNELAGMCHDAVKAMTHNAADATDFIMLWLCHYVDGARVKRMREEYRGKRWNRYFLHEWILRHFCHYVTRDHDALKLHPYEFLRHMGWYQYGRKSTISDVLRFDMVREAGIAIGWSFVHLSDKDRSRFIALMNQLAEDRDERLGEHAFFMILHSSQGWEGRDDVEIDKDLHPALRQIWQRGSRSATGHLAKIIKKHSATFTTNIPQLMRDQAHKRKKR